MPPLPPSSSGSSNSFDSSAPSSPEEQHIQRVLSEVERTLRQSMPRDNKRRTLEQIEQLTEKIGEEIKHSIQRDLTEQQGCGFEGSRCRCPSCGRSQGARYRGKRPREVVTLHGKLMLWRAYYLCDGCFRGFCPLDRELSLGNGKMSVSVVALLCRFACHMSFREAARELEIICGVQLSASTVMRYAEEVGRQLQEAQGTRREQVRRALETGDPEVKDKLCPHDGRPVRQQITMDGVMVNVDGDWCEAKLGCVYRPDRQTGAQDARYYATLAKSAQFGSYLHVLAVVSGSLQCPKVAVVADGAEWIWRESDKHFAFGTHILDFYHATEHLWRVARAMFGDKTEAEQSAAGTWTKEQQMLLLSGKAAEVLAAIQSWNPGGVEARVVRRRELGYLLDHHSHGRLNYAAYKSDGFHIGSGVIEAGCKNVIQSRMKQAGMRWSYSGAEAMLQMRAQWCSEKRPDFTPSARAVVALA